MIFGSSPFEWPYQRQHPTLSQEGGFNSYSNSETSSLYRPQDAEGKGKGTEEIEQQEENKVTPEVIDEAIFHTKEQAPKFAPPLHERGRPSRFGQTLFYSIA